MIVLSLAIGLLAVALWLPTISDLHSLLRARGGRRPAETDLSMRFLVLVPAHNEEMLLAECVQSLISMRYPSDRFRVVVIADNCTDRTAEIARREGAACLERTNAQLRGKPRAIEWALQLLAPSDYDMVVIVDADTLVDADFLMEIARLAPLREKAVQGYHGVSNPDENALTRLSAVFATARYRFSYPLKQAAGLNVPLMGNGMCVGSGVIDRYGWSAFSICEDWEMYTHLTARGVPIEGAPDAQVLSQEARSLEQSKTQRQRWAAGKLTVLMQNLLSILRSPSTSLPQKLDLIAELSAPGPVVHLGSVALMIALLAATGAPGAAGIGILLLGSLVRLSIYSVAAIRREARPLRALLSFLYLPIYAVWRLGVQLSALTMVGDKPWIRTRRHAARP